MTAGLPGNRDLPSCRPGKPVVKTLRHTRLRCSHASCTLPPIRLLTFSAGPGVAPVETKDPSIRNACQREAIESSRNE